MRIARWENGGGLAGVVEFSIILRKNGKYVVFENSVMAMNFFEPIGQFDTLQKAIGCFGLCIARTTGKAR